MKKKKAAELQARLNALSDKVSELERKVDREQQWETWNANRGTSSASTSFGFAPSDGIYYHDWDHDAVGPKEYR